MLHEIATWSQASSNRYGCQHDQILECPLPPYKGPYPKTDLQNARNRLYADVCSKFSFNNIITYLKPKLGLPPRRLVHPDTVTQLCHKEEPDYWHLNYEEVFNPRLFEKELAAIEESCDDNESDKDITECGNDNKVEEVLECGSVKDVEEIQIEDETNDVKQDSIFENNPDYIELIKCDFCDEMSKDEKTLKIHLKESRHLSASTYFAKKIVEEKKSMELFAVKESLSVTLDSSEADHIIVCPSCLCVFADIFSCGKHYKHNHDHEKRKYTICKIIKRQTVRIPMEPSCLKCSRKFVLHSQLHEHWRKLPSHLPCDTEVQEGCFMRFACMACERVSERSLIQAKNHALSCRMKRPGRLTVLLLVYTVENPEERNIRTLLPFAKDFISL
ncbi:DgyrCDS3519 [Dimorphilus gyrociliatus]|uniref:DgyrCDS3519 n=1 Tax=Dimorphilus gyrociliatus TaxID=2664684 RepID=A0A7I8VGK3_9ANNE|nr:DgyrCDS3519 [Dimorphilus gyrociliatus]